MPPASIFTPVEDEYIKCSVATMTHSEIAKELNIKYGYDKFTGKQVMGRANNKGWLRPKKHIYNRRFFENIDTTEKAYWFGFIYADGYIISDNIKNAEVAIQLMASDKPHLEKFNKALDGNVEVQELLTKECIIKKTGQIIKSFPSCRIRLYSLDMYKDLVDKQLLQNKTYQSVSPDLCYSKEINTAIIRGFFDGDGCIDKNDFCHFTAYSDVFLSKVENFLNENNIDTRLYKEREGKWRLRIYDRHVPLFLNLLYKDPTYTYLDRKYNLARKIIYNKLQ